ncbi:MAG TPA: PEP-CTERM sorting domain-containing protein, partial [Dehalococcoidia bacterium]|nr:PEP-CTERM sorting domain-containing protein [Dehalococcoidia bacterium]
VMEATPVGTMDIVHSGYGANGVMTVWGGGLSDLDVYGGVYMLNKTDGTGLGNIWPNGLIGGFCIELHQWSPDTTLKYDVVGLHEVNNSFMGGTMGTEKADYLAELWGRFYNPAWADGGPYSSEEKSKAEAFAAAVWEIIYEDLPASPLSWDVTTDGSAGAHGFFASNVDADAANSWLRALTGCGPKAQLMAVVNDGKQDFIIQVPEPATICLLGLGGLAFLRKRKCYSVKQLAT